MIPKEHLKLSKDQRWTDCIRCGARIKQIRKALFRCEKCGLEIIADEQDMRPGKWSGLR